MRYSTEPRTRKYVKRFEFLQEIYLTNSEKKLIGTATKAGLDVAKPASKKVYKTAEATEELTGQKMAQKIVKPKPILDVNSRNVKEIVTHQKKDKKCQKI